MYTDEEDGLGLEAQEISKIWDKIFTHTQCVFDALGDDGIWRMNCTFENLYIDPSTQEYHFISEALDQFWRMEPARILKPNEELWRKLFGGRGWYAVKLGKDRYDLRFNVH